MAFFRCSYGAGGGADMGNVQYGYFTPTADVVSNAGIEIAEYTGDALYAQLFTLDNTGATQIGYCVLDCSTLSAYAMNQTASGGTSSSVAKLTIDNTTHKLSFGGTSSVIKLAKDIKYMWIVYTM